MEKPTFIIVSGYGWSGSSAVVDYLKEFKTVYDSQVEFRLIKDPSGIMELESALFDNWEPIIVSNAIKKFIWFCKKCYNPNRMILSSIGLDYKNKLCKDFLKKTDVFLDSIVSYEYDMYCIYNSFLENYFEYIFQKAIRRISKLLKGGRIEYLYKPSEYFAKISKDKFYYEVREYIDSLFADIIEETGKTMIVLDQALSPNHSYRMKKYFNSSKMIIVDRDPRDIYVDMIYSMGLLGKDLSFTHDPKRYIMWHNSLRSTQEELKNNDILEINFENLVMNYNQTTKLIKQFIHLDEHDHVFIKKYFDPERSIKNIGKWKSYRFQDEINIITNELDIRHEE